MEFGMSIISIWICRYWNEISNTARSHPLHDRAAAVTGFVEGEDGFSLFIRAIPYNFYALLTIAMMIALALLKTDFGPMLRHERNAR